MLSTRVSKVVVVRAAAWAAAGVVLLLGLAQAQPAAAGLGPWVWPLAGPHEVSRPFAPPEVAYGAGHRGADLPAAAGAVVRAAGAGRISYAGMLAGRGVVVVVHGSLRTTYEPVLASVAVGDDVAPGDPIGTVEPAHLGCPVATCLHWGLRRGDAYLDPVRLVERGPVRLLPVDGAVRRDGPGAGAALRGRPGTSTARGPVEDPPIPAAPRADAVRPAPVAAAPARRLTAADAPLVAVAVVALVAGIALLARPRPGPERPPRSGAGRAVAPAVVEQEAAPGPPAQVLELDVERLRRRAG